MRIVLGLLILLLTLAANTGTANAYFTCGVEPAETKPIPPIGCRDVRHECTCDSSGNCIWVWICVQ